MGVSMEVPTVHARLCAVVAGGKGYGISHRWDGTVLTVTSDSGSSSADLAGPAGAKQFVVTMTGSEEPYTADKTFAEVKAALDDGNVVVADWTNLKLRGQLTGYSDDLLEFTFHSFLGADAYLILQSDNTVTHLVSEVGKEKIPSQVSVAKNGNVITVTATVSGSLGGFGDEVTTITLNDDGDPVSVTKDGKTTTLTWSGFDE